MRDSRESRLLLVLLIVIAFALITVDIRTGGSSPLAGARTAVASAMGPAERGVASVVDPVGRAVDSVRTAGKSRRTIDALRRDNDALRRKVAAGPLAAGRQKQLDKLLDTAGAGRYRIKAAQVIAIGASKGFTWTVTLDVGSRDGVRRDMTVVNGDGLVGRVTTVAPGTATVMLASDPSFTVGTRLEGSGQLGFASGEGESPMKMTLLDSRAKVKKGDRLVTFGSQKGHPFVPGVPIGKVRRIEATPGGITRTVEVTPYVRFTALDLVGVVVQPPRHDPRDAVLPPAPKPKSSAGAGRGAGHSAKHPDTPSGSPSAGSSAGPPAAGTPSAPASDAPDGAASGQPSPGVTGPPPGR